MGDTLTHVEWPRPGFTPQEIIDLARFEEELGRRLRTAFRTVEPPNQRNKVNGESSVANGPARELGVPSRLAQNDKILSELNNLACKLEDRLLSISQPLPPQPPSEPKKTEDASNHIHARLDCQQRRLIDLCKRLDNIFCRLEI